MSPVDLGLFIGVEVTPLSGDGLLLPPPLSCTDCDVCFLLFLYHRSGLYAVGYSVGCRRVGYGLFGGLFGWAVGLCGLWAVWGGAGVEVDAGQR